MKLLTACCLFLLLAPAVFSQTPKADPPKPVPVLSTAEKMALQSTVEKEKQLQSEFQSLEQGKAQVMAEFAGAHPGFHVNPQTFTVTADTPKPEKPAAQPGVPKPVPPPTYPSGGGQPK